MIVAGAAPMVNSGAACAAAGAMAAMATMAQRASPVDLRLRAISDYE